MKNVSVLAFLAKRRAEGAYDWQIVEEVWGRKPGAMQFRGQCGSVTKVCRAFQAAGLVEEAADHHFVITRAGVRALFGFGRARMSRKEQFDGSFGQRSI